MSLENADTLRVVDDRVLLLGLDRLYRDHIESYESVELFRCARRVAKTLGVEPDDGPVEGYYSILMGDEEYFRLMRALQDEPAERRSEVEHLMEYRRLLEVTSSRLYGPPLRPGEVSRALFPRGRDSLTRAMIENENDLTAATLVPAAAACARRDDDWSLVGLAALVEDPIVLAALRETVVLYAEPHYLSKFAGAGPPPGYAWEVSAELSERAERFVEEFNRLFDEFLPAPVPSAAEKYWTAGRENDIAGRCVRIAIDPLRGHYHWAIRAGTDGALEFEEFWDPEVWTTSSYGRRSEARS